MVQESEAGRTEKIQVWLESCQGLKLSQGFACSFWKAESLLQEQWRGF